MRIASVRIEKFRSFADATIPFNDYACLLGPNGSGSVLRLFQGRKSMPAATARGAGFTMWHSDIGAVIESEIGAAEWAAYRAEADKRYGHAGGLRKN
jgi:hypothetical protein